MLHIAAAFCLVGGSTAAAILNVLAIRSEQPSETAFLLKLIRYALPLIFAGVLGTLVFGIWLWHDLGFGFGTGWIWAALVFWALASALGGRGGRHQEQVRGARRAPGRRGRHDDRRAPRAAPRPEGARALYGAGVATLAILVLMIWKPGS